jgi:hypothetical protein
MNANTTHDRIFSLSQEREFYKGMFPKSQGRAEQFVEKDKPPEVP